MKMKVYGFLVNRVAGIRQVYHNTRYLYNSRRGRIYAWLLLILMNIAWLCGKRKFGADTSFPDQNKKLHTASSESLLSKHESPKALAERLLAYDVISFDIFDTLIFRPFDTPSGLFYFIGLELGYPDFARIRTEMEHLARTAALKKGESAEISLSDIWALIEYECGIDAKTGMEIEIKMEKRHCFANPYMSEVFTYLRENNKKIIAASDMYLPVEVIREIVCGCGFFGIDEIFVSCEYKKSKSDGALYGVITEKLGAGRFIQIGDNHHSDVKMAEKCGFSALHYPNVNTQGYSFRAEDMSAIGGSIYRGLVNSYIHNGCNLFNVDYELGFIYGGLFTVGYCQFIHEYAYAHELDKILFLSRDGDILKKVYDLLYPHDTYPIKTEYVYWSRLAAMKMGAGLFKHDYLRRFLYHKVNQGYSLKAVFQAMEISDMLKKCMDSIGVKTEETVLNESNVKSVKEFLINNWAEVLAHYNEELEAGREYYREVLKNCQKAAAVDVGWVGSGAVSLDKIVNKIWGFNCEITGLLAGTNTVHSAEANINEELFYTGKLKSYLFSQQHNRNLWKTHDAAKGDNLVVEMLLSSPTGGFKGFINGGFIFKNITETDQKKAGDCQKGILDFADYFIKHAPAAKVSASDAYAPIALLLNNSEYWKLVLSGEFKNANID